MEKTKSKKLLIIIDDVFPNKLSPFRYEEYSDYIKVFEKTLIIRNSSIRIPKDDLIGLPKEKIKIIRTDFEDLKIEKIEAYIKDYPQRICMIVFLNNIYGKNKKTLDFLEKNKIPFILTLYPGGGFHIAEDVERKLERIFSSEMFKKVIITQKNVEVYIKKRFNIPANKIKYIYGVVTSEALLNIDVKRRRHYKINNKINLNICFVAYKYSEQGKDKGYDIFIEVAKRLRKKHDDIYFHVVGNFDESDIDVEELYERIGFYGTHEIEWFKEFYEDKDIIISPCRNDVLTEGAFDGFPTGACTDALLNEVMVMTTDPLNMNYLYSNNKDLVIIEPSVSDIIKKVEYYINNPKEMYNIAKNGYEKANSIYSYEKQVLERRKIIKEIIENE